MNTIRQRSKWSGEGTLALTPRESERADCVRRSGLFSRTCLASDHGERCPFELTHRRAPSPGGEGWGEGEQSFRNSLGAFTLLEILIAVAAFAIVLAAINTVFYSALRLRNSTTAAIERALPMEHALGIIKRDLANIAAEIVGAECRARTRTTVARCSA